MLMLCFTYLNVIPKFVEFLYSFGYQVDAQDPYFSSFRQRTRLSTSSQTFEIPELGWSGSEIQVCYNLRSVEQSGSDSWSTRTCALHHTFDVRNVRVIWIIIKGNDRMKRRVEEATGGGGCSDMTCFEKLDRAFAASLATHLVFCDWAAEGWRWYINNLEDQFQDTSRRALTAPVTVPLIAPASNDQLRMRSRTDTQKSNDSFVARISRAQTSLTEKIPNASSKPRSPVRRTYTDPATKLTQPLPPHIMLSNSQTTFENPKEEDFSFAKLQSLQQIEERTHSALLTLKLNIGIIHQLKQYYDTVVRSQYFPQEIGQLCQYDLEQFELRVSGVVNDLQMQILRLETLLRLLRNRKSLVSQIAQSVQNFELRHDQLHSILELQNTEANKQSTKSMIAMTRDMNEIARQTKIETVSMKVITVVTLFFLPGTFISVCKVLFPQHSWFPRSLPLPERFTVAFFLRFPRLASERAFPRSTYEEGMTGQQTKIVSHPPRRIR